MTKTITNEKKVMKYVIFIFLKEHHAIICHQKRQHEIFEGRSAAIKAKIS